MKEVTMEMLLSELSRLAIETRNGFATVNIEQKNLRADMNAGFAKVDAEFKAIGKDLKVIREQTAHLTERVTILEDVNKDGPSA